MRTGWYRAGCEEQGEPLALVARRGVLNEMRMIENAGWALRRETRIKPGTPSRKDFVTPLAFRATIGRPDRFTKSRDVGAHPGLPPCRCQSGESRGGRALRSANSLSSCSASGPMAPHPVAKQRHLSHPFRHEEIIGGRPEIGFRAAEKRRSRGGERQRDLVDGPEPGAASHQGRETDRDGLPS
jgi:hypothetical protein